MSDIPTYPEDEATRRADFDDERRKLQEVERPIQAATRRESSGQKKSEKTADDIRKYLAGDADDYAAFMSDKTLAQNSLQRADRYRLIASNPYFYHIELRRASGGIESFVVGKQGLILGSRQVIVDWRTPMGGLYARKQERDYVVNGKKYTLLLRRAASINKGVLQSIDTEYDASMRELPGEVVDPFLIQVLLDKRRNYRLSDIIATIQERQNEIMRQPANKSFVVQGCAGSGKTMILLHRLSYLTYNNGSSDADLDRYAIITPSDFFDRHIDELSTQLDVERIRRFTLAGFYNYLIGTLAGPDTYKEERDGKTATRTKVPVPQGVNPNEANLDHALLRDAYSKQFIEGLYKAIDDEKDEVLSLLAKEGLNAYFAERGMSAPSEGDTPFAIYTLLDKNLRRMEEAASGVREALERASKELGDARRELADIRSRIKPANERYAAARRDVSDALAGATSKAAAPQDEEDPGREETYLEELSAALERGDIALPIYAGIMRSEELADALHRYVDYITSLTAAEMSLLTSQSSRLELYQSRVEERAATEAAAKEKLGSNRDNRLAGPLRECIQFLDARQFWALAEDRLARLYRKHGVNYTPRRNYPHRILACLAFCTRYYGAARTGLRLVSVDEAQDISPAEYEVLASALGPDVTYNLYGDVGQLVSDYRGVKEWDEVPEAFGGPVHRLNQNYRNTLEITDYCNRSFGKNMTGIGLKGKRVRHTTARYAADILKALRDGNRNMRVAVIYKGDIAPVKTAVGSVFAGDIDWKKPAESDVAVLTVTESKGLEFDGVLVIEDGMTKNELYVAYTRALDNLFVSSLNTTRHDSGGESSTDAPRPTKTPRSNKPDQGTADKDLGTKPEPPARPGQMVKVIELANTLFGERGTSESTRQMARRFVNSLAIQQKGGEAVNDSVSIAKERLMSAPPLSGHAAAEDLIDGWEYDERKTVIIIGCLIDHASELVKRQEAEDRAKHAEYERRAHLAKAQLRTNADAAPRAVVRTARPTTHPHAPKVPKRPKRPSIRQTLAEAAQLRHAPREVIIEVSNILATMDPRTSGYGKKHRKAFQSGIIEAAEDYIRRNPDKYTGGPYWRYAQKIVSGSATRYLLNWQSNGDIAMLLCLALVDILMDYGLTYLDNV